MEWLLPLVKAVNPRRLSGIKLLRGDNHAMRLYRLLQADKGLAEDEIRRRLFGENPYSDIYFSEAKRELRERLVNTLIGLPPEATESKPLQAYQRCTKELAAIQQLLGKGARKAAAELAHRTIRVALRFQFTEQVVSLARILYLHHAAMDVDRGQKEEYRQLADLYMRINQAEWELELMFNELAFRQTVSKTLKLDSNLHPDVSRAQVLMQEFPFSYRLHLLGYNLLSLNYINENDHERVIETCRMAIAFFRQLNYPVPPPTVFSFAYKLIPSLIQLQRFEEARTSIGECFQLAPRGSVNWFITVHYEIILGFHSGDYPAAYQAMLKLKDHQIPFPALKEQMLIAEAYVALFIRAGRIKEGIPPSFRLGKFLNEVPTYSRDKRGMNINIIILQTLFLLLAGNLDLIIDRTEALAMYTHRYLRRDENFRSNCFIRLLLLLPQHGFHPRAVERHAKPLLEKLRTAPNRADYDVEIVPYMVLWNLIMERLSVPSSGH